MGLEDKAPDGTPVRPAPASDDIQPGETPSQWIARLLEKERNRDRD